MFMSGDFGIRWEEKKSAGRNVLFSHLTYGLHNIALVRRGKEGNLGCGGGWPHWAMEYVIANKGIDTEASYPYVARVSVQMLELRMWSFVDQKCKYNESSIGSNCVEYNAVLPAGDEASLEGAVATVGPISLWGYDKSSGGQDYWIVKNSWGTDWGQEGYIWMSRNENNQCGIATNASYPTVTA
eukprot:Em0017g869a